MRTGMDLRVERKERDRVKTGENIRAARKKAGLSQEELAQRIGVKRAAVSKWEKDARNVKIGTIKEIAEALDVQFESLISDANEERSNPMSKNSDNDTSLAALGMALGTMGMGSGRMSLSEEKKDADKSCVKALAHMAETMETLSGLVKDLRSVEKPDEFDHENIVELTGKMATLATSMSTLRMSIGLGAAPSIPGGYPTA